MKTILVSTIAALVVLPSLTIHAQSVVEQARKDDVVFMKDEDPAMQAAMSRARAELDQFLDLARQPPAGTTGYALKVGVSDGDDTEYFWVADFSEQADSFTGRIDNEPRLVSTVKMGQNFHFHRSQIVDWIYIDKAKRKMVGNYTMCALLTKEPPEQAAAAKEQFGLECDL